jgi:transposase
VSDLLKTIGEGERQGFFRKWMKKIADKDYLCYDLTSVSSYSDLNEYVKWGHNRDNEKLPQINLGMLYGQMSGLPAYYRRLPGSIGDVAALRNTVSSLDFIGQSKLVFVMDRGFYSIPNADALFDARMNFVLGLPQRKWLCELYDQHREEVFTPWNRRETGGNEVLYVKTILHKWGERRCYVHVYYNNFANAAAADKLDLKLTRLMGELTSGRDDPIHKEDYKRFFTVTETPVRGRKVTEKTAAVNAARDKYAGFFSIMTTKKMDAADALDIYRRKEVVENCFDDLKNTLDMNRLRIHSSQAMDARLFIQFISLILLSRLRSIKNASAFPSLKRISTRDIMEAMETIAEVTYSGRYGSIVTETDPLQRDIIEAFGITVES